MVAYNQIAGWMRPRNLFGTRGRVGGLQYFLVGLTLGVIKYIVEGIVVWAVTGKGYTPLDYVNPFLSGREKFLEAGPEWLGFA